MSNVHSPTEDQSTSDSNSGGEQIPQDDALNSSEQRNPGLELRLDGEGKIKADTLYTDGIEIEEDYDTPAGTHGSSGTIP